MGYEYTQPCRDFLYFKETQNKENKELQDIIIQQGKMIIQNDKRIAILEQQNKLTFWVYALITTGLVGIIFKML